MGGKGFIWFLNHLLTGMHIQGDSSLSIWSMQAPCNWLWQIGPLESIGAFTGNPKTQHDQIKHLEMSANSVPGNFSDMVFFPLKIAILRLDSMLRQNQLDVPWAPQRKRQCPACGRGTCGPAPQGAASCRRSKTESVLLYIFVGYSYIHTHVIHVIHVISYHDLISGNHSNSLQQPLGPFGHSPLPWS